MSLLGSIGSYLSPALTVGTEAANANVEGQREGNALLRALQLQQANLAHLNAQTVNTEANTAHTLHQNRAPVLGDPDYGTAKQAESEGTALGQSSPAVATSQANAIRIKSPAEAQQKYQEALATLPLDIQKMVTQGNINLQNGFKIATQRQNFEQGQQGRQQAAESQRQAQGEANTFANHMEEERLKANNSLMGRILPSNIPKVTPGDAPSAQGATPPAKPTKTGNIFIDGPNE